MTLEQAVEGLLDAEAKLSTREALSSPHLISENMYRLGQYASAVEKHLGEIEELYEVTWAQMYAACTTPTVVEQPDGTLKTIKGMSATAAKQQADVETAILKGQIKKLSRYVGSSWKIHTGAMARWNHLQSEMKGVM